MYFLCCRVVDVYIKSCLFFVFSLKNKNKYVQRFKYILLGCVFLYNDILTKIVFTRYFNHLFDSVECLPKIVIGSIPNYSFETIF